MPGDPTPARLEVGRIGRAHGLRGEVAVTLSSDRTERVAVGSRLDAGERTLTVAAARPHQGRWLVRFEEVADRTDAESLRGEVLRAEPLEGIDDVLWVHELVGAEVRDPHGTRIGPVLAVEDNPASDLLVVDHDGREVLVPTVFVVSHDAGVVVIDPPDGLLDLGSAR